MEIKTKLLSGEWVEVSPHTINRLDAENAVLKDDLASERRNRCCGNCRYYETASRYNDGEVCVYGTDARTTALLPKISQCMPACERWVSCME